MSISATSGGGVGRAAGSSGREDGVLDGTEVRVEDGGEDGALDGVGVGVDEGSRVGLSEGAYSFAKIGHSSNVR